MWVPSWLGSGEDPFSDCLACRQLTSCSVLTWSKGYLSSSYKDTNPVMGASLMTYLPPKVLTSKYYHIRDSPYEFWGFTSIQSIENELLFSVEYILMVRVCCEVWKSEIPNLPPSVMEELHFPVLFSVCFSLPFLASPFFPFPLCIFSFHLRCSHYLTLY